MRQTKKSQPQFSVEDLRTPERLELVLRQFQKALFPTQGKQLFPTTAQLVAQLAPLLRDQLQVGGIAPLNITSLLPGNISSLVVEGTHMQRLQIYPAGNYLQGTLYYETDRTLFYIVAPHPTTGLLAWVYAFGTWRNTHALRPGGKVSGATNATPIEITTTTNHNLSTGDSAWVFGVLGNTAANGEWLVTRTSATTFLLNGSAGNGAYTAGTGAVCGFGLVDTGVLYYETDVDRHSTYRVMTVSAALRYIIQPELSWPGQGVQANLPTDLGTKGDNSDFFRFDVVDYQHTLQWQTTVWAFVPEDSGSNFFIDAPGVPEGGVWHELDGAAINYLKADGSLGSITLPDEKTAPAGVYHKSIAAYTGTINAAVAPTFAGTPATLTGTVTSTFTGSGGTTGAPSATTTVDNDLVISTVAVASATHTHAFTPAGSVSSTLTMNSYTPAGTIDATAEPRNMGVRRFFRQ